MDFHVFERDRVSTDDDGKTVSFLNEFLKLADAGAGRISDDQPCGQMDHLGPVLFHFFRDVLDISSGASAAIRIAHHLDGLVLGITGKTAHSLSNGAETFAPATGLIPSADDDADSFH